MQQTLDKTTVRMCVQKHSSREQFQCNQDTISIFLLGQPSGELTENSRAPGGTCVLMM